MLAREEDLYGMVKYSQTPWIGRIKNLSNQEAWLQHRVR